MELTAATARGMMPEGEYREFMGRVESRVREAALAGRAYLSVVFDPDEWVAYSSRFYNDMTQAGYHVPRFAVIGTPRRPIAVNVYWAG